MRYYAYIETKINGRTDKELSPNFNNQLQAEMWLSSCIREAKSLGVKVVDHYVGKFEPITA